MLHADARERYDRASDGRRKGYSVHANDRTPDQPVHLKDVVRPMGGRDGRLAQRPGMTSERRG